MYEELCTIVIELGTLANGSLANEHLDEKSKPLPQTEILVPPTVGPLRGEKRSSWI